MKVELEVRTPVHVGAGNMAQIEWSIRDGYLYRFSFEKLVETLDLKKLESLRRFTDPKSFNWDNIIDKLGIKNEEQNFLFYKIPIKANEISGKRIEEFIKTLVRADGNSNETLVPYIPGSDIKGSLRRAVAIRILRKVKPTYDKLVSGLEKILNDETGGGKRVEKLIKFAMEIENTLFSPFSGKPNEDFFKFVKVSDAFPCKRNTEGILALTRVKIYYYFNAKPIRGFQGLLTEVLIPKRKFIFELKVDKRAYSKFRKTLESSEFEKERNQKEKKHQEDKELQKKVLNFFDNLFNSDEPEKELLKIWGEEEKRNLQEDKDLLSLLERLKTPGVAADRGGFAVDKAKKVLEKLLQDDRYLIRLGKHEGFYFTTVVPVLKESENQKDKKLLEKLIFTLKSRKRRKGEIITRKLALYKTKKNDIVPLPLGFCLLKPDD